MVGDLWDRLQVEGPYHRCRDAAQMAFNFKGFLPPPDTQAALDTVVKVVL